MPIENKPCREQLRATLCAAERARGAFLDGSSDQELGGMVFAYQE